MRSDRIPHQSSGSDRIDQAFAVARIRPMAGSSCRLLASSSLKWQLYISSKLKAYKSGIAKSKVYSIFSSLMKTVEG